MKLKVTRPFIKMTLALLLLSIGVFWGVQSFGQELSAEQKEVTNVIKIVWDSLVKGDYETVDKLWHKDGAWWGAAFDLPQDKNTYLGGLKKIKFPSAEVKPVEVKVVGNTALMHYYYSFTVAGNSNVMSGRAAATLTKLDGKWIVVGLLMSSCSQLSPCIPMPSK